MTNKRILFIELALASLVLPWTLHAGPSAVCNATADPGLTPATVNGAIGQRLMGEERASWNLAIQRNAVAYKAFHASDFFTVTGTGVVDRIPSEASAMDSQVRFDQCELSGFNVHFVAGDAALLTYHVKASGLDHGKAFTLESYASSLWMKRSGHWLNVFYQATPARDH
ncbi:DUF4440 domain-containing protein [Dyella flava]|uniref:Nuclear transport factor 2 family protein n=1 Tax=Dyella flava TaxID=1920170 RepID=A0ABS2K429_9GAMM|nr:nuclear transport factor 2 family protein [Dyella flava]MBM7125644.1 nuclear transport factor 2 family protein [Dyella flava]GLQ48842.1 hypothetical protein GCM10010872_02910 [Dyella flava]